MGVDVTALPCVMGAVGQRSSRGAVSVRRSAVELRGAREGGGVAVTADRRRGRRLGGGGSGVRKHGRLCLGEKTVQGKLID